MRLLLDSHILLWWLADNPSLPAAARRAIANPRSEIFVSAASVWELAIKAALGRLVFPTATIAEALANEGFLPLGMEVAHAVAAAALPLHHHDPFDRMLIAQAQLEGLMLVTVDEIARRYDVTTLDI